MTYIGSGGAGNYVKMVHNGIEYGDMQLIAESYDILKQVRHHHQLHHDSNSVCVCVCVHCEYFRWVI